MALCLGRLVLVVSGTWFEGTLCLCALLVSSPEISYVVFQRVMIMIVLACYDPYDSALWVTTRLDKKTVDLMILQWIEPTLLFIKYLGPGLLSEIVRATRLLLLHTSAQTGTRSYTELNDHETLFIHIIIYIQSCVI